MAKPLTCPSCCQKAFEPTGKKDAKYDGHNVAATVFTCGVCAYSITAVLLADLPDGVEENPDKPIKEDKP